MKFASGQRVKVWTALILRKPDVLKSRIFGVCFQSPKTFKKSYGIWEREWCFGALNYQY